RRSQASSTRRECAELPTRWRWCPRASRGLQRCSSAHGHSHALKERHQERQHRHEAYPRPRVSKASIGVPSICRAGILSVASYVSGGRQCAIREHGQQRHRGRVMSTEQNNKAIVKRWFTDFWGESWNPGSVDDLCTPDILLQYLLQAPHRGRADVKAFMIT